MRSIGDLIVRYHALYSERYTIYKKQALEPKAINCKHRAKGLCLLSILPEGHCILNDDTLINTIGTNSCAHFSFFTVKELKSIFKTGVVTGQARELSELYWVLDNSIKGIKGLWNKIISKFML